MHLLTRTPTLALGTLGRTEKNYVARYQQEWQDKSQLCLQISVLNRYLCFFGLVIHPADTSAALLSKEQIDVFFLQ